MSCGLGDYVIYVQWSLNYQSGSYPITAHIWLFLSLQYAWVTEGLMNAAFITILGLSFLLILLLFYYV